MIEGEFPSQLQSAFRGMERAQNPWGINHEQRLAWADGLNVKTTDENPTPDVLYWVGCAASYDPQAQKTARAFVELLNHAEVNFAVLGKKECCTGDSARRSGNEYLYRQLADKNVSTLNTVQPKLIVASCPHCMNSIGHEYKQIGGDYKVMHHTEYLETLVANKKLTPTPQRSDHHLPRPLLPRPPQRRLRRPPQPPQHPQQQHRHRTPPQPRKRLLLRRRRSAVLERRRRRRRAHLRQPLPRSPANPRPRSRRKSPRRRLPLLQEHARQHPQQSRLRRHRHQRRRRTPPRRRPPQQRPHHPNHRHQTRAKNHPIPRPKTSSS